MSEILRTVIFLTLVLSTLLFWLGDFNEYIVIEGSQYVDSRPQPAARLAHGVSISALASLLTGAALLVLRQAGIRSLRAGFLTLAVAFSAILFFFGDLNGYVVGHGPG